MKWYRPIKTTKDLNNKFGLMATAVVLALTLSVVAIIFAVGKVDNAA